MDPHILLHIVTLTSHRSPITLTLKVATRGKTSKYWARYALEKQAKMHARDVLLASDTFAEEGDEAVCNVPEPIKSRDNKKRSARDKARRLARDAKAEHAFWPAEDDEPIKSIELPAAIEGPLLSVTARMGESAPSVPAGWWSVVGKHGKIVKYERPSKRRPRTRKVEEPPESIWALEEAAGPSKCLRALYDATSHRVKVPCHNLPCRVVAPGGLGWLGMAWDG